MKLFYCPRCDDFVKAGIGELRFCRCRLSAANYLMDKKDGLLTSTVMLHGQAIALGINNRSFTKALQARHDTSGGPIEFAAFVIPDGNDSIADLKGIL